MFSYARPSELSVLSSSFYWATSSCVTSAGEIAIVIVAGTDLWRALSARMHAKVLVCQLEVSPHTSLQALLLAQENNGQSGHLSSYCLSLSVCLGKQQYIWM